MNEVFFHLRQFSHSFIVQTEYIVKIELKSNLKTEILFLLYTQSFREHPRPEPLFH